MTTCQGMNLPDSCNAFFAAISSPPQHGTSMRTMVTDLMSFSRKISVTIVRMEVPCCGGLEMAAKKALQESGKFIPWQVVTISLDGKILDA